jgi:hypothetical protein
MAANTRMKIAAPILLIGGILVTVGGFNEHAVAGRLKEEGKDVIGRVVSHEIHRGRRGSKTYKITVQYAPTNGGGNIRGTFDVSKALHDGSSNGAPIGIRYLPSDPKVAEVAGAGTSGIGTIGLGAFLFALGGLLGFLAFRK